jgi:hypothetical protein
MLYGRVTRHSLLGCLLLHHVSQAMVGHDPLNWVVVIIVLFDRSLNLRVYARASDLFISSKLVDSEPNVWCCVLTWRRDIRLCVHVESRLRVSRLLCAWSLLCDCRDGGRLRWNVVVGLLWVLPWDAHAL